MNSSPSPPVSSLSPLSSSSVATAMANSSDHSPHSDGDGERSSTTVCQHQQRKRNRGPAPNFAEKLHLVLAIPECNGSTVAVDQLILLLCRSDANITSPLLTLPIIINKDCVHWLSSGRGFCITDQKKFAKEILPKYIASTSSFNSFERRLKTWGFRKVDTAKSLLIFSHDSFFNKKDEGCLLNDDVTVNKTECRDVIGMLPSGKSFCIADLVRKEYVGETCLNRFVTSLKKNCFERMSTSEHNGAVYSHDLFQRDRPDLCKLMSRDNKFKSDDCFDTMDGVTHQTVQQLLLRSTTPFNADVNDGTTTSPKLEYVHREVALSRADLVHRQSGMAELIKQYEIARRRVECDMQILMLGIEEQILKIQELKLRAMKRRFSS
ncbi:predicted protein [Thalassiosira pseudonana CCMP1335]|uniref:HSF-type DNA-binding domain-containing protein n=1 Tax=Thalassiosira pseudonana TaxID=35128 RepID=B8CB24_THAPS|nr:predicted protein [Thalassiosira pseudonana CCMP1335]EED89242.1 predicted protein [Thalassiosira pseudonana CCMP1335]